MKVILNNWLAKLLSLGLAVILWLVIHRSLAATVSPSEFQIELEKHFQAKDKFQLDFSSHGSPKK